MNYLVEKLLASTTGFDLEVTVAIIIGIILLIAIIILTVKEIIKEK